MENEELRNVNFLILAGRVDLAPEPAEGTKPTDTHTSDLSAHTLALFSLFSLSESLSPF